MKKKILLAIVAIILIAGAWYFFRDRNKTTVISSSQVERQDIRKTLILSGEVEAKDHVQLHFQSGGLLSWVGVKEGDTVRKNQAIASLDKRSLRKMLDQKLNLYMTNRWNFEQTQDDNRDWEVKGMSDEEREAIKRIVEKSQFGLNNAVIDVELQDLTIRLATIYTPIAGRVIQADPQHAGVNINPSTSIYEIVDPSTIYFSVAADQTDVINFQEGQSVTVTLDSYSDKPITGRLNYISYTPDPKESGTVYRIRVESEELSSNNQIKLGMTGDAEFTIAEKKDTLVISNEYIQSDNDGNTFLITDQTGTKTPVEIGIEGDEYTEIISGVQSGQPVYLLEQ